MVMQTYCQPNSISSFIRAITFILHNFFKPHLYYKSLTMSSNVSITRNTRMSDLINYRLRVTIVDGRAFVGQLLAFDKHMNLVLADTEEARITKKGYQELAKNKVSGQVKVAEEKRYLGLIILRGEQVVNLTIRSGPTADIKKRLVQLKSGKGVARQLKVPVSQKNKLRGPQRSSGG